MEVPEVISELISEYKGPTLRVRDGSIKFSAKERPLFEGEIKVRNGLWSSILGPTNFAMGELFQPLIFYHQSFDISTLSSLQINPVSSRAGYFRAGYFHDGILTLCSGQSILSIAMDIDKSLPQRLRNTQGNRAGPSMTIYPNVWGNDSVLIFLFSESGVEYREILGEAIEDYLYDQERKIIDKYHGEIGAHSHEDGSFIFSTKDVYKYFPTLDKRFGHREADVFITDKSEAFIRDVETEREKFFVPISQAAPIIQELWPIVGARTAVDRGDINKYSWVARLWHRVVDDSKFDLRSEPKITIIDENSYKIEEEEE